YWLFLKSPDLEAEARPDVETATAYWTVIPHKAVREPDLQIDRAKVVAEQGTGGSLLCAEAANIKTGHRREHTTASAGIVGCLELEIANRADRPLAKLIEGSEVAIQIITARYGGV